MKRNYDDQKRQQIQWERANILQVFDKLDGFSISFDMIWTPEARYLYHCRFIYMLYVYLLLENEKIFSNRLNFTHTFLKIKKKNYFLHAYYNVSRSLYVIYIYYVSSYSEFHWNGFSTPTTFLRMKKKPLLVIYNSS